MSDSWIVRVPCTRDEAEMISSNPPDFGILDFDPVLIVREQEMDNPASWAMEAFCADEPDETQIAALLALLPVSGEKATPVIEHLEPQDWVTLSQAGLEPIRAGPFYIHTSQDAPCNDPGVRNFRIDPAQAFGTGHHDTTHGCLLALSTLHSRRHRFARIADVGTGTGLLAFAARHLWPQARIIASDIDAVAVRLARDYARSNHVRLGKGPGSVCLYPAIGTNHPEIRHNAPYDLLIANILAGPLIDLAPSFAAAVGTGGSLLLAGLMDNQKKGVIAAYRRHGFRLAHYWPRGDWPVLHFVRYKVAMPFRKSATPARAIGTGEW